MRTARDSPNIPYSPKLLLLMCVRFGLWIDWEELKRNDVVSTFSNLVGHTVFALVTTAILIWGRDNSCSQFTRVGNLITEIRE